MVSKFWTCVHALNYRVDKIDATKDAFDSALARIRNGLSKLRDLLSLLTRKGLPLIARWFSVRLNKDVYVIKMKKNDSTIAKIMNNTRTKYKMFVVELRNRLRLGITMVNCLLNSNIFKGSVNNI